MKSDNNSILTAVVIVTTLLTCGLMIPVWIFIGIIILIVKLVSPTPKIKQPEITYIPPSNDFASDWVFEVRDISNGNDND